MSGLIIIICIIAFALAIKSIEKDIEKMERHLENFRKENEVKGLEKNN